MVTGDVVSDRVEKVRLPKADTSVDHERVVLLGRHFRDRERRGIRKSVALSGHVGLERKARLEQSM